MCWDHYDNMKHKIGKLCYVSESGKHILVDTMFGYRIQEYSMEDNRVLNTFCADRIPCEDDCGFTGETYICPESKSMIYTWSPKKGSKRITLSAPYCALDEHFITTKHPDGSIEVVEV